MRLYQKALIPLAAVNRGIAAARRAAYHSGWLTPERLDGPVISVGNLTTGGTGKTPMVLYLAERLARDGRRPAILTRGYGGPATAAGKDGRGLADEPALLAERLSGIGEEGKSFFLCQGADRRGSGQRALAQGAGCLLLDDGFQHLSLARDLDIVMVDATNPFDNRHVLPAGQLRESPAALRAAGIVVVTRGPADERIEREMRSLTDARFFRSTTQLEGIFRGKRAQAGNALNGERVFAFCAIGNPGAFLSDLKRWGVRACGQRAFRDHHKFTGAEMVALRAEAKSAGAEALMCTEKDIFNLPPEEAQATDIFHCRIRLELDDSEAFWAIVGNVAGKKSGGAAA